MESYKIKIANFNKLRRLVNVFILIVGLSVLTTVIWLGVNKVKIELPVFLISLVVLVFVIPVVLLLLMRTTSLKRDVSVNQAGIDTQEFGLIRFDSIINVQRMLNFHGMNSLIIIKTNDQRRISFSTCNKYSGVANHNFDSFKYEFEKGLRNSSAGNNSQ